MVTRNQHLDQRMNWFDRQFLRAQDFADESDYHVDRLRRHLRTLHTPGVAEGLLVRGQTGDGSVTVDPGTAIDAQGREIVLLTASPALPLPSSSTAAELYVSYTEASTNQSQDPGITGYTRITETPTFDFRETAPGASAPGPAGGILLARLAIAAGRLGSEPDNTVRIDAGAVGASGAGGNNISTFSVTLKRVGQPATTWPRLTASGSSEVTLAGDLRLTSQGAATGALNVPGRLTLGDGMQFGTAAPITAISRDPWLAAASDAAVPTEAAVKNYVDRLIASQARQLGIQSGAATVSAKPSNHRQVRTIRFESAFAVQPKVIIATQDIHLAFKDTSSSYDIEVQKVTNTQFDIMCFVGDNKTEVGVDVMWLAYGPMA